MITTIKDDIYSNIDHYKALVRPQIEYWNRLSQIGNMKTIANENCDKSIRYLLLIDITTRLNVDTESAIIALDDMGLEIFK